MTICRTDNFHKPYFSTIIGLICSLSLLGCANPQFRARTLEKFSTNVAMHLFDRNPDTINESMTYLFREELAEPVITKLQKANKLPKTELSILRIVDENQQHHESNTVKVQKVEALGPTKEELIPFHVAGIVTTTIKGKPDTAKPFSIKMKVKMGSDINDNPKVVDLTEDLPVLKKRQKSRKHHN